MPTDAVILLLPEIVLAVVAVGIYMAGTMLDARAAGLWGWVALGGIIVAAAALAGSPPAGAVGPLTTDALAYYIRWLTLGVGTILTLTVLRPLDTPGTPEYIGSLLLAVAGTMLTAVARDLVLLFVALELVSIPTYIMLYLGRHDADAQEAAGKYFFLSILSSALVLYGFSFLYGVGGSTDLGVIADRFSAASAAAANPYVAYLALVLVFAGLGFRITAVPFHFYAPDVYQGTTHANAGFLSVIPKIAGFLALVRIVALAMGGAGPQTWRIAVALAVVTMTLGNVVALWQTNIRRLLAYSAIAHAGYMLVGLAVFLASPAENRFYDGLAAILVYLAVYGVATLGTFAALACLGRGQRQIDAVDELAGLAWTGGTLRPLLAWLIAAFMFSLAGIPPLAGFFGKLVIFGSALGVAGSEETRLWLLMLAVLGVLNAAVSAAYYLRIVSVMFFRMPLATPRFQEEGGGALAATVLCALLTIIMGVICLPLASHASPAPRAVLRQAVEHRAPAADSAVPVRSAAVAVAGSRR